MNDSLYTMASRLGSSHMDNFPEELREVVNDHWAQFPPQIWGQNPMVVQFFAIFYFLVTFICEHFSDLCLFVKQRVTNSGEY